MHADSVTLRRLGGRYPSRAIDDDFHLLRAAAGAGEIEVADDPAR
ncbi:hypothetical protein KV112_17835 [Mycolicibacter sp. MYC123]|uniref:Uncharacterized protein n=1 Tax=[Mycobacterium] zoologicum TaxID=2872311 RepID=A0ABU5YNE0_9MYCO|nr:MULTISPECIES: hypothetical protein [unclassified Mycolicibacter]MEB3051575.1 hypothetical protein [Mycolicibacter sp. MYC123]MEB3061396.1 hypothetical protein [Mycolicibacter sp. MYC101]